MHIALLSAVISIPEAHSLKDKRRVLKGFKDRLRNRYNVSVCEVDGQDSVLRAVLAVAMVGCDRRYVEGRLQGIVSAAAMHRDMILVDQVIEWL